jgi:hypothetical protein
MKDLDIGDIRPKQVIDIQDDKDQVLHSPSVQASGSQVSSQQQAISSQIDQSNVQVSLSNQVQVLQPTNDVSRSYYWGY